MQERAAIPADVAGEWLREHFADDTESKVEVAWTVNEEHDPDAYCRLLQLLFSPRPDSPAA
jgi:hypothetical protein